MEENRKKFSKGTALYLSIIILAVISIIIFTLINIANLQIKITTGIENSLVAFFAADTGIEEMLMERSNPLVGENVYSGYLDIDENGSFDPKKDASYKVSVKEGGVDFCQAQNYCVISLGEYKGKVRSIEIKY